MYWQLFESYNLMSDLLLRIETHLRLAEAQGNNRIVFKLLYEAAQEIQFLCVMYFTIGEAVLPQCCDRIAGKTNLKIFNRVKIVSDAVQQSLLFGEVHSFTSSHRV